MSETKQKLLDTSLDLIWQHSYGSVSVDDICKASGVKKGSFYHFFASKSDLIVAAYEEHWSKYKLTYEEVFDRKKPGLRRFEDWCSRVICNQQEIFDTKGKVLGCPYATVGSEMGTQDENVRKKSKEIFERGEQYIAVAIADAIAERTLPATLEPERLSQEIMSYMIGVLLNARVQNDPEVIRRDLRKGLFSLLGVNIQSEAA
jgi:TetR/AcrR family transcriptional repressor of nem operon